MRRMALLVIATALVWCGTAIGQDIEPSSMPGDGIASEQQQPLTLFKDSYFGQPKAEVLAAGAERITGKGGKVFYIKRNVFFAGQTWDASYTFFDSDTLQAVTLFSHVTPVRKAIAAARTLVKSGFYPLVIIDGFDEVERRKLLDQGLKLKDFAGTDEDIISLAKEVLRISKGRALYLENIPVSKLLEGFEPTEDYFNRIPDSTRDVFMQWNSPEDDIKGSVSVRFEYQKLSDKYIVDEAGGGKEDF